MGPVKLHQPESKVLKGEFEGEDPVVESKSEEFFEDSKTWRIVIH